MGGTGLFLLSIIMRKYKLILFDFDGTLVDTAPDISLHANSILNEFGLPVHAVSEIKKAVGRGVHELFKDLEPRFKEEPELLEKTVVSFKRRYWDLPVIHTKPYPGVVEMLSGPLGFFRKAIVTNKPHDLTQKILDKLSLSGYFEMVIGLDLAYPPKPDPAAVRHVLEALKAAPADALYIGDSKIDGQTCKNAGIDFAWVDYGYGGLDGITPTMKFSSPSEWQSLASFVIK